MKEKIKEIIQNKEIMKRIVPVLVLMLILVIGSTYAYFSINVSGGKTNTSISIETGKLNSIAITNKIPNIHINLKASDMSSTSEIKEFYATDKENLPYETYNNRILNIAEITVVGDIEVKNFCTADVTVAFTEGDSMGDVLLEGDSELYIEAGNLRETLDLSEIKNTRSQTYTANFEIEDSEPHAIQAYLKISNREADQSYLAGRELHLKIEINNFSCTTDVEAPTITKFYINEDKEGEKYTNNQNVKANILWNDEDAVSYCITESQNNCNSWKDIKETDKQDKHIEQEMTLVGTGEKRLYAYLKDGVGNVSNVKSDSIIIDTEKPVITSYYINEQKAGQKYTKEATITHYISYSSEDIEKMCITTTNNVESCKWENPNSTKTETLSTEGTKTYYVFVKDKAGNTSANGNTTTITDNIIYDKTAPTIQKVESTSIAQTSIGVEVTANSGDISGIKQYCYGTSQNGSYDCTNTNIHTFKNLNAEQEYTFWFYLIDNAGNNGTPAQYKFTTETKPATEVILTNSHSLESESALTTRNNTITTGTKDDLRRFVGDYKTVTDNFICFGTTNQNQCKDNMDTYMYRIIGIDTQNRLKVIKATKIVKDTQNTFQWHNDYYADIKWNASDLYKGLNGNSLNYFIGNTKYSYMSQPQWTNLIDTTTYYIGDSPNENNPESFIGERRESFNNAKLGLMYLSDYLYASNKNTSNWLFIENGLNGASNTGSGTSTPFEEAEWTMTRYGYYSWNNYYGARVVNSNGYVDDFSYLNFTLAVRPVFYIDSSKIKLKGTGIIEDPYYITNVN